MLEAPDLGNEDGVMLKDQSSGKLTTRRYSAEEKSAAVRMVRALRAELGTEHGTVQRVALQLGYGIESVRTCGCARPTSTTGMPLGCRLLSRRGSSNSNRRTGNSSVPTRS